MILVAKIKKPNKHESIKRLELAVKRAHYLISDELLIVAKNAAEAFVRFFKACSKIKNK